MSYLKRILSMFVVCSLGFGAATTLAAPKETAPPAKGAKAAKAKKPNRTQAGAVVNPGGDSLVTLCYRARTIQVPFYLQGRYTSNGATVGPCVVTQL